MQKTLSDVQPDTSRSWDHTETPSELDSGDLEYIAGLHSNPTPNSLPLLNVAAATPGSPQLVAQPIRRGTIRVEGSPSAIGSAKKRKVRLQAGCPTLPWHSGSLRCQISRRVG
ncbi:hypothetical protein WJX84_009902 [Apatococcus fuscideae]|uniref:Uncharacterized protein n=1 Tax=Apatococcus fuscideae TaxID=2026836 RepID=A0AAW1SSS0_9CHLO